MGNSQNNNDKNNQALEQQEEQVYDNTIPQQRNFQQQQQQQYQQYQFEQKQQQLLPNKLDDDDEISVTATTQNNKKKVEYDLQKGVSLTLKTKQVHIKLNEKESQKIPILLSLKTKDSTEENQNQQEEEDNSRTAVDLICVVDHSGSMSGEKMKLVIATLNYLLTILNENDRLSIVIFDDTVQRLNPLQRMNKQNIDSLKEKINKISADGGTTISKGMNLALNMIKNRKFKNQVTSIFLLSDGQDGSATKQTQDLMKQYDIQDAFTISTFGFGADHDEKLMKNIAQLKDGSFYYIEQLSLVDEAFVDALGGLISVIGQNVKIEGQVVRQPPFSDIRVHQTFGNWVKDDETQICKLDMNQLLSGISKDFIFEVNIPPMKKKLEDEQKNNICIFKAAVTIQDLTPEHKSVTLQQQLAVTFYNFDEDVQVQNDIDQSVIAEYFRVQGAYILDQANLLAQQNKFNEAQQQLDKMIKDIQESNVKDLPQIKVLLTDLEQSKQACKPQEYKEYGAKYMISRQMVHQNQQSSAMQMPMQMSNQQMQMDEIDDPYANSKQKKYLTSLRKQKQ